MVVLRGVAVSYERGTPVAWQGGKLEMDAEALARVVAPVLLLLLYSRYRS